MDEKGIACATDQFLYAVTVLHDPGTIAAMFAPEGGLIGTMSQVLRIGEDISRYFDYFVHLPGIIVLKKSYTISQLSPSIFLNTAIVNWHWEGLPPEGLTAHMSFVYQGSLIYQLSTPFVRYADFEPGVTTAYGSPLSP